MQLLFKKQLKIVSFILIILVAPLNFNGQVRAEDSSTEVIQLDDLNDEDEKSNKKKKKDKEDEIELGQKLFLSLSVNFFTLLLLVGFYFKTYRKIDLVFTFVVFNTVIFILTTVFNEVKISTGAAFGMFAIFSMLRYRTEGISAKDMSYLFIAIAIGLINSIKLDYSVLAFFNGLILLLVFLLDGNILMKRQQTKLVVYEKIDLIKPENEKQMLEDLQARTGLTIKKFTVNKIDFLRDVALIEIVFTHEKN